MPRKKIVHRYKTSALVEKRSVKPVFYFLLLFFSLFVILNLRNADGYKKVLPFSSISDEPRTSAELSLAIRKKLQDVPGTYSIKYEDLTTKNGFSIRDDMVVTAASVIKIPVLAATYELADEGEINLDEEIIIPEADMQRWGTGIIRYEDAGVSYTIRELSQILMEKSDNTAVYVLAHHVVGLDRLAEKIEQWGLTHTVYESNTITNTDMNMLLKAMYFGDFIERAELHEEMIQWMDDSDFEQRIPKYLPEDVDVYHKIGNEVRITHDVGIVNVPEAPYYIGILAKDVADPELAKETIAEISKLIYEYQIRMYGEVN